MTGSGQAAASRARGELPSLAIGGVRQAGTDVLRGEVRDIREELLLRHPGGQVFEDIVDGDAKAANAGFPAPFAGLAAMKRLPSVGYASCADAGGLIAYGANRPAQYGRAGYFLDRIFKGEKPGEIPFERAARFDLIVNAKTARSLGLALSPSLLLRADAFSAEESGKFPAKMP